MASWHHNWVGWTSRAAGGQNARSAGAILPPPQLISVGVVALGGTDTGRFLDSSA